MKSPRPNYRRELYDIGDDDDVPLIFPTRQVQETGSAHRHSNGDIGRTASADATRSQGGR